MNQNDLRERLDALQEQLMTLYELGPTDLSSQIKHYQLLRKESVLEYYARKEGYEVLGLHHLPVLKVSEHNAKQAIKMILHLESLAKSAYKHETWTLNDTSADRFMSPPRNCFKKDSFEVTVWFDHNPQNAFPYINWKWIYYQDNNDQWHKVPGRTDHNGLYFIEHDNTVTYFLLFAKDAERYGKTKEWTVNIGNEQILPPSVTSSSRRSLSDSPEVNRGASTSTYAEAEEENRRGSLQPQTTSPSTTTYSPSRRRRRRGQGESTTNKRRRRAERDGGADTVSPDEVGQSHQLVRSTGLTRTERLKEEAKDPPIVSISGPANKLKCWRYRCGLKTSKNYTYMSSVFKWITGDVGLGDGRMLVAFANTQQRNQFINALTLPKDMSYCLGNLEKL
ncbi:E2 [Human papillomavirus 154]|uniref:Regulatory protein E2 n=1 Tax=Human papillomavirus 154 TaxID=1195796 RepID=R9QBR5_9PAPI|nr:E2 [Human papillomavirus 154]AFL02849.1 E2 [Human papillomavirus 154]